MHYSLPNNPEIVIEVPGKKDTPSAREKAMKKVLSMLDDGEVELPDGFSDTQLVIVSSTSSEAADLSDPVISATETVRHFAKVKARLEKNFSSAEAARSAIARAFESPESISEDDIAAVESGSESLLEYLKALKEEVGMLRAVEEARKVLSGLLGLESAKSDRSEPGKDAVSEAVDFNTLATAQDFRASADVANSNGHADHLLVASAS